MSVDRSTDDPGEYCVGRVVDYRDGADSPMPFERDALRPDGEMNLIDVLAGRDENQADRSHEAEITMRRRLVVRKIKPPE